MFFGGAACWHNGPFSVVGGGSLWDAPTDSDLEDVLVVDDDDDDDDDDMMVIYYIFGWYDRCETFNRIYVSVFTIYQLVTESGSALQNYWKPEERICRSGTHLQRFGSLVGDNIGFEYSNIPIAPMPRCLFGFDQVFLRFNRSGLKNDPYMRLTQITIRIVKDLSPLEMFPTLFIWFVSVPFLWHVSLSVFILEKCLTWSNDGRIPVMTFGSACGCMPVCGVCILSQFMTVVFWFF